MEDEDEMSDEDDDEFSSEENAEVEDNETEMLKQDMETPIEDLMLAGNMVAGTNNSENSTETNTSSRAHLSRFNHNQDLHDAIYNDPGQQEEEDKDKEYKPQISSKSRNNKGKQEVRIGDNYQVDKLPDLIPAHEAHEHYVAGNIVYETPCYIPMEKYYKKYDPDKLKTAYLFEAEEFLASVDEGKLRRRPRKRDARRDGKFPDDELALTCLFDCKFDKDKAWPVYQEKKEMKLKKAQWTEREAESFEEAFLALTAQSSDKRKDFYAISHRVEGKSRADCVEFYYQWKKSMRYDVFLQRNIKKLYPKTSDSQRDNMLLVVNDYADKLMQGIDEAVHRQYTLHHQQEGHQEDSNIKTHHAALQEFLESLKSKEEPQHNHDRHRPSGNLNGSTVSNGSVNSQRENINPENKTKEFMSMDMS